MRLLMDAEVLSLVGAQRYQRTEERTTYRNGYREREWQTRVGDIPLQIPSCAMARTFPAFLNHVGAPSEHCLLSSSKPISRA